MSEYSPSEDGPFVTANTAAKYYWSLGLEPIPLPANQKRPRDSWKTPLQWTDEEIDRKFSPVGNVGLALGERSGNLIDIDFHWWEAADMAFDRLEGLPIFGRKSSPICHRLARGKLPSGLVQFRIPNKATHLFDAESSVVLELKGDGHQTTVPPSIHPSGEYLEWWPESFAPKRADKIPDLNVQELIEDAGLFAALAVITRAYSSSSKNRDDVCTAIAATFLRLGFETDETDDFVVKAAFDSGEEEWRECYSYADATLARLKAGEDIGGISALCDLLGIEPMADTLREWLCLGGSNNDGGGGNVVTVSNSNCSPKTLEGSATPVRFSEGGYSQYDDARRYRGRILTDDERAKLKRISDQIASNFGVADRDAHFALLNKLSEIMDTGSEVKLVEGQVAAPVDQPTFKQTKHELLKLRDHLASAVEIMHKAMDNETFAAALHFSDEDGRLDQHYQSLVALAAAVDRAATLQGRPGTQSNEDWVADFCLACQEFWSSHKGRATRIVFHTVFRTPITGWVAELFVKLGDFKGQVHDLAKLKTAAKYLPAYRPLNNNG